MKLADVAAALLNILNQISKLAGRCYGQEQASVVDAPSLQLRLMGIEDRIYIGGGKRRAIYSFTARLFVQFSDNAAAEADLMSLVAAIYDQLDTHKRTGWGAGSTVTDVEPTGTASTGYATSNGVVYRSIDIPIRVESEEEVSYA